MEITISAEGVYSVNNHLLPKSDLATLSEAIERESGGDNKLPLAISADGKTRTRRWSPRWMPPASSVSASCA